MYPNRAKFNNTRDKLLDMTETALAQENDTCFGAPVIGAKAPDVTYYCTESRVQYMPVESRELHPFLAAHKTDPKGKLASDREHAMREEARRILTKPEPAVDKLTTTYRVGYDKDVGPGLVRSYDPVKAAMHPLYSTGMSWKGEDLGKTTRAPGTKIETSLLPGDKVWFGKKAPFTKSLHSATKTMID